MDGCKSKPRAKVQRQPMKEAENDQKPHTPSEMDNMAKLNRLKPKLVMIRKAVSFTETNSPTIAPSTQ